MTDNAVETVYVAGKSRPIIDKTVKIGNVTLNCNDATALVRALCSSDQLSKLSDDLGRTDYYNDVRGLAEDIKDRLASGDIEDRDSLIEDIEQSVDGSGRVIYTGQAMDCLRYSDNDGAYVEDFGSDGLVQNGSVNWSAMAYAAFRQDVIEHLDAIGVDVNSPFKCEDCDQTFDSFDELKEHKTDTHTIEDEV